MRVLDEPHVTSYLFGFFLKLKMQMYSYSGASIFCHHFLFFLCLCLFLSPFNEEVQIPCQEEEIHVVKRQTTAAQKRRILETSN